jgi:DNA ligase (NAD+)
VNIKERLTKARQDYAETGESGLTDDEWDAMRNWAESTGVSVSSLPELPSSTHWPVVRHLHQMYSIPECKSLEELEQFGKNDLGFLSLKYDGLSIELQYDHGTLNRCVLRGDGYQGEDVTPNARRAMCVPANLPTSMLTGSVFGELVISFNNLDELNKIRTDAGLNPYKSPRNAVAVIRAKTVTTQVMALFRVRAFDTTFGDSRLGQDDRLKLLRDLNAMMRGPTTIKFDPVVVKRVTPADAWLKVQDVAIARDDYQYQMDGMVFRYKDGTSVKLKFPPQSAVTTVRDVVEQLGRTGVVAPRVVFDPVELVSATVRCASVHNSDLVATKLSGLGIGAVVLISRRGDVIPHVESVIKPAEVPWTPRQDCPSCGAEVVQDGSIRRCSADPGACPGSVVGLIVEFCRRMGIDGFGPGVSGALVSEGVVSTPADLYMMDPEIVAAVRTPGGAVIGDTIANRLAAKVDSRSEVGWGELLGSLCIPGCAKSVMEAVAGRFHDPESLRAANRDELVSVDGVGPERAASITAFVESRWDDIMALAGVVKIRQPGGRMAGKVICITLGLRTCGRPEMEARIHQAGGDVKGSVSKRVTHVVCNYPDDSTTKLKRARELGIPIVGEDELLGWLGQSQETEEDFDEQADF